MKSHEIIGGRTSLVYEVRKMRTPQSSYLPTYHFRVHSNSTRPDEWSDLTMDTLAEVRQFLANR